MSAIIKEKNKKIKKKKKSFLKNISHFWFSGTGFFILLLLFTSSVSFMLGKLSVWESMQVAQKKEITVQQSQKQENTQVVASKSGSVYHLPWCPGAVSMSEKNKIFFPTKKLAEDAGYRAAKNCEGL